MTDDNPSQIPPSAPVAGGAPPAFAPDTAPKAAPTRNVVGLVSIILAAIGFALAIIPLLGIVGWPLLVAALVLGIVGLTRKGQPKTTSIAGLILSVLAMILAPIIAIAILAGSASSSEPTNGDESDAPAAVEEQPSAESPGDAPEEPAAEEPAPEEPASGSATPLGTAADVDGMSITVTGVETGIANVGSDTFGEAAQGQFVLVHVSVSNTGMKPDSFNSLAVTVFDDQGREFSASSSAALYLDDGSVFFEDVNPGNTLNGTIVFDLPAGAVPTTFEYDPLFGSKATLALR
ncbi:DUF4352 domain-containing protein [Microbacterium sp. ZW T5_45]|uniref:DUF4352 domain-containing protein n=1 Tax=Microbacterium sp. ZW T5_45 TaxID=3378080 RepID=UPI00385423F1